MRSGLAGVRVVALALASCATIPTPHDASDTVLMLRKYDAWAWAAGVALICADLVLPVPQTVVIAALGIIYASVLGVLLSAPLSGPGIGIRQLGVKPRHPFTETGMTGFSAEPSIPRPAAHGRVCPSGPIGQPPRLAELGVGSCRFRVDLTPFANSTYGIHLGEAQDGCLLPKSSQAGYSLRTRRGPCR